MHRCGEDGVEIVELTSAVLEIRDIAGEVDGETERVEDPRLVASLGRSRDHSLGAVRARALERMASFTPENATAAPTRPSS